MSLFFLELQQTNIPTPQNVTPPPFPPNKKKIPSTLRQKTSPHPKFFTLFSFSNINNKQNSSLKKTEKTI